jgi:cell division septal protein FtsQ
MWQRKIRLLYVTIIIFLKEGLSWFSFGSCIALSICISFDKSIPLGNTASLRICPLENISITTVYPIKKEEVKSLVDKFLLRIKRKKDYISLLTLPEKQLRNFLLAYPLIEEVEVKKCYPSDLEIKVRPALPIAFIDLNELIKNKNIYLDINGRLFFLSRKLGNLVSFGWEERDEFLSPDKLRRVASIIRNIKETALYPKIERIILTNDRLALYLKNYPNVVIYLVQLPKNYLREVENESNKSWDIEIKYRTCKLEGILAYLDISKLEYIDLRFPNAAYIKFKPDKISKEYNNHSLVTQLNEADH